MRAVKIAFALVAGGLLLLAVTFPALGLADKPAGVDKRTRPASSMQVTLPSVKLSLTDDSGKTSTRPSLPRLTTALEPFAVVTVLSETMVVPEVVRVSLTVTSPTTEMLPVACPG